MEKKANKNAERTQKGLKNRTEFAQEYSIETGSPSNKKCNKTNNTNNNSNKPNTNQTK